MAKSAKSESVQRSSRGASVDRVLRLLPGGGKPLDGVSDRTTDELLRLAEGLVEVARRELGNDASKPRAQAVAELFATQAGQPPEVPQTLDEDLRRQDLVEQVAQADEAWDKSIAKSVNEFDQISIQSGSKIQSAADNWRLACRVYESEARSAAAIFKAEIEKARADADRNQGSSRNELDGQVDYYTRSKPIAAGLVKYEQSMATAAGALATAFGALIKDVFDGATSVSVGEARLIEGTESASEDFWSSVQSHATSRA